MDEETAGTIQETHEETQTESENPIVAVAGQFGLNGQMFTAQLINFLLVLIVLWRFAYRPIVRMLDEREEKIEKSVKQADEIEKRVSEIEKERDEVMNTARREAQEIADKAHKQGEERREEIIGAAKREVERVIVKGKEQLVAEKEAMMRELKKEIIDIAMKAATRSAEDQIDESKSKSLAEEAVRKMI